MATSAPAPASAPILQSSVFEEDKPNPTAASTQFISALASNVILPRQIQNYKCVICAERPGNLTPITIVADLPPDFAIEYGADYQESVSQGLKGVIPGKLDSIAKLGGLSLMTKSLTAQIWQGSSEVHFSIPIILQVETDAKRDVLEPLAALYSLVLPGEPTGGGFLRSPGPRLNYEKLVRGAVVAANDLITTGGSALAEGVATVIDAYKAVSMNNANSAVNTTITATGTAGGTVVTGADTVAGRADDLLRQSIENTVSLRLGNYMRFDYVVVTSVQQLHSTMPLQDGTMSRVEVTVGFKTFFTPTSRDIPKMLINLGDWDGNSSQGTAAGTPAAR
jgi:hypothetical protein